MPLLVHHMHFYVQTKYTQLKVTASTWSSQYKCFADVQSISLFNVVISIIYSKVYRINPVTNTYLNIQRKKGIRIHTPQFRRLIWPFWFFTQNTVIGALTCVASIFSRRNNYIKYCFKSCTTTRLKVPINKKKSMYTAAWFI